MADYCKQCSEDIFGKDYGDLKGLVSSGSFAVVLCEGCGDIVVDDNGNCTTHNHFTGDTEERPSNERLEHFKRGGRD